MPFFIVSAKDRGKMSKIHTAGKLGRWIFMPWITPTSTMSLKMSFHCLQLSILFSLYYYFCFWMVCLEKGLCMGYKASLNPVAIRKDKKQCEGMAE